ncbi:MAG TPA: cytochrome D1 domain-containing protein [Candidatus Limnocylindrales bacterium]|jgi:YVTN family beta-propeller protein|nr:cytochrome D1 domain-containing protein [Candidatus Limnocylindrales bacterium]
MNLVAAFSQSYFFALSFGRLHVLSGLTLAAILALLAQFHVEAETSSAKGFLLVANKGDHTLGIIDPESCRQVATIEEDGITGHEVAASVDGRRAFVPIYGNSGVGHAGTDGRLMRVIDLEQRKIVGTVDFGKGVRPHCAVVNPKTGLLYITTELDNSVTVIDPQTLKIIGTIPTSQPEAHMLAVTRDGRRGYTANVGPGTVSALDLEAKKVIAVIPISATTQRISLSVDDRWVFTSDQTKPQLAVIDTASNKVKGWVAMSGTGYGTAPTPNGRWLVVALPGVNKVAAVDLDSMKVAHEIDVPKAPQEVLVRPDGAVAYVSCDASKQVAVIDLQNWKVDKLIDAGPGADGLAWAVR